MENSALWLLAGAVLVALEAFGAPGVGLLFAGLAAFAVALLIKAGMVDSAGYALQCVWFFGLTAAWAALLWKPMRRWRAGSGRAEYHNIVGDSAVVAAGGLARGAVGQVEWSGTLMRAQIAVQEAAEFIEAGANVRITGVEGNTLFVTRNS